jgi:hypothetical protein
MAERLNNGTGAATCDGCYVIVRYGHDIPGAWRQEVRAYVTLPVPSPGPVRPLHFCAENGRGEVGCLRKALEALEDCDAAERAVIEAELARD